MTSEFLRKYIKYFGLLLVFYYYIFPQALAVGSNSIIIPMAALGLGLYLLHRCPFNEVFKVLIFFALLIFWFYTATFLNDTNSQFHIMYIRSQMGWFFAAYLVVFLLFYIHKRPDFNTLVLYIVGALLLQSVIAFLINQYPAVRDFFFSIQINDDVSTRERLENERLIGNGTGLFGAGVTFGAALIIYIYILVSNKYSSFKLIILSIAFAITFFIGLFMARTTVVGLGVAAAYLLIYMIFNKNYSNKVQFFKFIGFCTLFFSIGASLAYIYFPSFTDWAFELFINYQRTGEISTRSSDGIMGMFVIPEDTKTFFVGSGILTFMGSDVGYTRLLYYAGIIGTILFFAYQAYIISFCITKNGAANLMIISIFAHCLISNVKGIVDENYYLYLFFFFFVFYKHYVYYPKIYKTALSQIPIKQAHI